MKYILPRKSLSQHQLKRVELFLFVGIQVKSRRLEQLIMALNVIVNRHYTLENPYACNGYAYKQRYLYFQTAVYMLPNSGILARGE